MEQMPSQDSLRQEVLENKKLKAKDINEVELERLFDIKTESKAPHYRFQVDTEDPENVCTINISEINEYGADPGEPVDFDYELTGKIIVNLNENGELVYEENGETTDNQVGEKIKKSIEGKLQ